MSEYQYYEFQAIDRPLTSQEQAEIRKLSSRVQLTRDRAIFVYNFGDFPSAPEAILARYFDVMLYVANWGTWRFMFRFPAALVDTNWFVPFAIRHGITISSTSEYVILDIEVSQEEGIETWLEDEEWLSRLLPLRDDLLRGDVRLLYLAWLRIAPLLAELTLEADPVEPMVPPNLDRLSEPLQTFVQLIELNPDLVTAAAQKSSHQLNFSEEVPLENWLGELSETERQEFLLKLVRREPNADLQLIKRLQELAGITRSLPRSSPGGRRVSELEAIARTLKQEREQREWEAARKQRIQELEALSLKEEETWNRIAQILDRKQAKTYDEATALLKDLRDLAKHQGRLSEFTQRFEQLKSNYPSRPALVKRFRSVQV